MGIYKKYNKLWAVFDMQVLKMKLGSRENDSNSQDCQTWGFKPHFRFLLTSGPINRTELFR